MISGKVTRQAVYLEAVRENIRQMRLTLPSTWALHRELERIENLAEQGLAPPRRVTHAWDVVAGVRYDLTHKSTEETA